MNRDELVQAVQPASDEERLLAYYERRYDYANIPMKPRKAKLSAIPDDLDYKRQVREWQARVVEAYKSGKVEDGLYLYGPIGTGKTALAAMLQMWAERHRLRSYYVRFIDLYKLERDNPQYHKDVDSGVWDVLKSVPLLVVDDVMAQVTDRYGKYNAYALQSLLDYRLGEGGLLHIFTSNLPLSDYSGGEHERLAHLILQACYPVEITGVDFRESINAHRKSL